MFRSNFLSPRYLNSYHEIPKLEPLLWIWRAGGAGPHPIGKSASWAGLQAMISRQEAWTGTFAAATKPLGKSLNGRASDSDH